MSIWWCEQRLQEDGPPDEGYAAMSGLHRRTSQPEQAAELDARRLELWRHWDRKLPDNSFVRRQIQAKRLP